MDQPASARARIDSGPLDNELAQLSLSALDEEIADLEQRLQTAKAQRLQRQPQMPRPLYADDDEQQQRQQHFLFLLSDSALPLGSFAFSSGLESFLAHSKKLSSPASSSAAAGSDAFAAFLPVSVASYARTSLPFVLAAHDVAAAAMAEAKAKATAPHHHPPSPSSRAASSSSLADKLARLDDTYDATLMCTVGRRASVAQGRALLSVWERAFAPTLGWTAGGDEAGPISEDPLRPYAQLVKRSSAAANANANANSASTAASSFTAAPPPAHAHLPPLFGAVAALAGLQRRQTADVFVLAHVKALVSAAVRASLVGPYQAQRLLASAGVRAIVSRAVATAWDAAGTGLGGVEEAAQTAPVVDLWMGRHELLYSRIFNS